MCNELQIRPGVTEDLSALLDLYHHLDPQDARCPDEIAPEIFEKFQRYPGSALLVGAMDAQIVTTCALIVIPNLTRGGTPYALIENVVTHADFRNMGFGKAILRAAADRALSYGCYKVMLMTGSSRQSTLHFYESAGFEQTKTGFQIRLRPPRLR